MSAKNALSVYSVIKRLERILLRILKITFEEMLLDLLERIGVEKNHRLRIKIEGFDSL
jgi:hypothetical protein